MSTFSISSSSSAFPLKMPSSFTKLLLIALIIQVTLCMDKETTNSSQDDISITDQAAPELTQEEQEATKRFEREIKESKDQDQANKPHYIPGSEKFYQPNYSQAPLDHISWADFLQSFKTTGGLHEARVAQEHYKSETSVLDRQQFRKLLVALHDESLFYGEESHIPIIRDEAEIFVDNQLDDLGKESFNLRDFYDQMVRTEAYQWYQIQESEAPHRLRQRDQQAGKSEL